MLKKISQQNRFLTRFLSLAIISASFFAFTKRTVVVPDDKAAINGAPPITVIIDAGHGGEDAGARSQDGIAEKDLNLELTNKIAALNSNKNIKIITTRSDDRKVDLRDRVEMARKNKADLFLSVHIDNTPELGEKEIKSTPFNIFISRNDNPNTAKTKMMGSSLPES